jgi:hypothetical protein
MDTPKGIEGMHTDLELISNIDYEQPGFYRSKLSTTTPTM